MQIYTATASQKKKSGTVLVVAVVVVILANLSDTVRAEGTIKLSDYSRYDDSPKNSYNSEHANDADSESANNLISRKRRYDGAQVWRILVEDDKQKQAIQEMEERFDGQVWRSIKQEIDYLVKSNSIEEAREFIRATNLSHVVLIEDLQKIIEEENPPKEEIEKFQNRKGHRMTWQAYHKTSDIHGYLDYLAQTYPNLCTVESIGRSVQGRQLKVLRISNGKQGNPAIWMDGGIHAREWISPATVTYVANEIVENFEDLPKYMQNTDYYILPVANPDGYEYTFNSDRLWRKNMRQHGRQCPGVDLNRNFGYQWGGKGTSATPCHQTYRGATAFSEPETAAIRTYVTKLGGKYLKGFLSFHSYGQYILFPWGYDNILTQDYSDLNRVGREAAAKIASNGNVKYTVGTSAKTLYPAAGGSDDWAKGTVGVKYAYTIEMRDTGRYGFVLPAEMIPVNGKDGYDFVETVAKNINLNRSHDDDTL